MPSPQPSQARYETQTHASLLARLNAPHTTDAHAAWTEFVTRYGELISGFCRARGLHQADTDDILQDVLLALTRSMPGFTYDPAKGKFRAYLKTVTLHAIFKKSSQRRRETLLGDGDRALGASAPPASPTPAAPHTQADLQAPELHPDPDSETQWETQWRRYHLRRAMTIIDNEFSARDREAFERYAVLGHDPHAVASELNIKPDNLYKIKSRLTRRLAELISQQVDEEG